MRTTSFRRPKSFRSGSQRGLALAKDGNTVKVVVVGDGSVGKTCMLSSFITGDFPREYVPTVFENHEVEREVDGIKARLEIWDTAGQEEYEALRQKSYLDTDVFLMVFAVNKPDSFENLASKWVMEIKQFSPNAALVVVGCKADLRDDDGAIAEAESYGKVRTSLCMDMALFFKELRRNGRMVAFARHPNDFFGGSPVDLEHLMSIKPMRSVEEYEQRATLAAEKYLECSALAREGLEDLFAEVVRVHRRMLLSGGADEGMEGRAGGSGRKSCVLS